MFLIFLFSILLFGVTGRVWALDETTRYSGYRASSMPEINKSSHGSTISVAFDWVESTQAFDKKGIKTSLFSDCGPVLLNQFSDAIPGPITPPDFAAFSEREKFKYLVTNVLQLSDDEATILFSAKYRQMQAVFNVMQNIGSGIFVHLEIPVKKQVINEIGWEPLLPRDKFESVAGGISRDTKYEGLKKLIDDEYEGATPGEKGSFQRVLTEAGFVDFRKEFREISFGDISFYLGWAGEKDFEESIVQYAEGALRLGLVGPTGRTTMQDRVFSLPFGSEHHWAVAGRGNGELGLFSWCAVGGSLGATIFFPKKYVMRLHDRAEARGWVRLDSEKVRVNRGSLWDLNLYAKAFYNPWGLSAWMGGSYASQGNTRFTDPVDAEKYSNELLHSDERNTGWQHFGLQFGVAFDVRKISKKRILPLMKCTYDYSVAGEKVWKSNVIGGSLGIYFEWTW
jgi:hypothetical protein